MTAILLALLLWNPAPVHGWRFYYGPPPQNMLEVYVPTVEFNVPVLEPGEVFYYKLVSLNCVCLPCCESRTALIPR